LAGAGGGGELPAVLHPISRPIVVPCCPPPQIEGGESRGGRMS
jgi:hypothetical protein